MTGLRQDAARVTAAIAATERTVAGTLRALAAEDRNHGRTAAADRREARARDAEQFAARESAAAEEFAAAHVPARKGTPADEVTPKSADGT
jgi:hypothetical protein